MTREELEKGFEDATKKSNDAIQQAKEKRSSEVKHYIENLPIKVGDFVEIIDYEGNKKRAFIGYIGDRYSRVHISFNKAKKDGTMGQQSAGIYSFESIEAIKQP